MEIGHWHRFNHQHFFLLRGTSIDDSDCVEDPGFEASLFWDLIIMRSESPFSHVDTSLQLDSQVDIDDKVCLLDLLSLLRAFHLWYSTAIFLAPPTVSSGLDLDLG
jgi:hypothetical protein